MICRALKPESVGEPVIIPINSNLYVKGKLASAGACQARTSSLCELLNSLFGSCMKPVWSMWLIYHACLQTGFSSMSAPDITLKKMPQTRTIIFGERCVRLPPTSRTKFHLFFSFLLLPPPPPYSSHLPSCPLQTLPSTLNQLQHAKS